MLRDDVAKRRGILAESLKGYLDLKRGAIAEVLGRVRSLGSAGAVAEPDRLANARNATVAEGVFLEQTVGADDKAPINFLELGMRASRAVCRIVDSRRIALGTGFLVAPGVVITNHHVLSNAEDAEGCFAEFMYENDADEQALKPRRFILDPVRLFVTSPEAKLDFSFIGLSTVSEGGEPLEAQGWIPMDSRRNKILDGHPVVVIQHPNGNLKTICMFDSVCRFRDADPAQPYLLYTTDTDFGSSGSPAFNRFWQLVALHHAAVPFQDEAGKTIAMNRGIRISSILGALAAGPVAGTVFGGSEKIRDLHTLLSAPTTVKNGRPFAAAGAAVAAPALSLVGAVGEAQGTIIQRKSADHLAGRKGYDPAFLVPEAAKPTIRDRLTVKLPRLPEFLIEDTARLTGKPNEYELTYTHFSIVMSKSRGLAVLTACNIDGGQMYRLGRKDRNPDAPAKNVVPEAAADIWFYDPRLPDSQQIGPDLLDRTTFEYGHIVRRLDPVWGDAADPRTPRIANDDTFFMTNCSPQEKHFHRERENGDGNWSALEDVILNEVNLKDIRASVFTGPVLDPRDPTILGVKVPRAFWKIVAYADEGRLKAHGFMLWQDREVAEVDAQHERALTFTAAKRPVAIREIGRLTSLDFGSLLAADVRS